MPKNEKETGNEIPGKPEFPIRTIQDVKNQIKGKPICRQPNCHGRGYTGVRLNKDGSETLMICVCGEYGETEWTQFMRSHDYIAQGLIGLSYRMAAQDIAMKQMFEKLERRTLIGILINASRYIHLKLWKSWKWKREGEIKPDLHVIDEATPALKTSLDRVIEEARQLEIQGDVKA